jgi:hypothetical protein
LGVFVACHSVKSVQRWLLTEWSLVRVRPGESKNQGVSGVAAGPLVLPRTICPSSYGGREQQGVTLEPAAR